MKLSLLFIESHFMKPLALVTLICSSILANAQFITNNGIAITNSAVITTNGDWMNAAGTSIKNDGRISTTESWINNGTLDPSSKGAFVLNYATPKSFTSGGS